MTKLDEIGLNWLNKNYGDLERFSHEKYPDYIFHVKNGKCILQHNKENGCVYVSYSEIWSFFKDYFSMEYQQIQYLTKVWVEEQYKLGVTTTSIDNNALDRSVEEQYKLGVTTTTMLGDIYLYEAEEQYKLGVTTTTGYAGSRYLRVEEQYKLGVTTTTNDLLKPGKEVEEQYNTK